jgi:glucose-6-phosphate isomerase
MANWVFRSFESLYKPYAKRRRAAYYELINGRLLLNSAYRQVSEIRVAYPGEVPD